MLFKKSVNPPAPPSDEEMKAAYASMSYDALCELRLQLGHQLELIDEVIGSVGPDALAELIDQMYGSKEEDLL